jgi:hypothetical protein
MIVKHTFGPEGAAYVRSYFASSRGFGKRLGSLLERRDIEAGTTWAFVPAASSARQRVDFEHGMVLPGAAASTSSWSAVANWLGALLGSPPSGRLLCVEDAMARRSDPWLVNEADRKVFFCGDDVYHCAGADDELDHFVLAAAASWKPDIGIVTALPSGREQISNRQSLEPESLEGMAARAVAVVIGAWDAEGFVLWQQVDQSELGGPAPSGLDPGLQ